MKTKEENVRARFGKALVALGQIEVLMENHFYDIVVNRIYYSCFYAASAALMQLDVTPKTHKGVHMQFGLHFVQTGLVPNELANTLPATFFMRQKQDYNDFDEINIETIERLSTSAKKFVEKLQEFIDNKQK